MLNIIRVIAASFILAFSWLWELRFGISYQYQKYQQMNKSSLHFSITVTATEVKSTEAEQEKFA